MKSLYLRANLQLPIHKKSFINSQFGFQKGHSTSHAITCLTEIIRQSLDKNEFVIGTFIDLKKGFDTVDHDILIKKLNHYGIRGVANDLLKSYLSGRSHCVKINNTQSNFVKIENGVPQGAILSLFIIPCVY